MNIDNKLLNLKSFLSENRMNQSGVKTTLSESAVSGMDKNNVEMTLDDDAKNGNERSKKKQKNKTSTKEATKNAAPITPQTNEELKLTNLKKLNLL